MRVFLITQNEPFFLLDSFKYLFSNLPDDIEIVGCAVFKGSPFGKNQNFIIKSLNTLKIFGIRFFLYYSVWFILNKLTRKPSVEKFIIKNSVPILSIYGSINSEKSLDAIRSYEPDLLVSIAGNQIFKKPLIDIGKKGCLNLHTAMLPKYRGLMPTFWALKNKEDFIGVSVFFIDEGIDSGPIICQQAIKVDDRTHKEIIKITKKIGMDLIIKAFHKIKNENYTLMPNKESESSYYSFPTRSDVLEYKKNGGKFF